jgi:uncharacterized Zn finger protein (UPF0148 family)
MLAPFLAAFQLDFSSGKNVTNALDLGEKMVDLDKLPIEIACPRCGYPFEIEMIDVRLESRVFCPNCKSHIRLHDYEGSSHAAKAEIEGALERLNQTLRKLGT